MTPPWSGVGPEGKTEEGAGQGRGHGGQAGQATPEEGSQELSHKHLARHQGDGSVVNSVHFFCCSNFTLPMLK